MVNKPLNDQIGLLLKIVLSNPYIRRILEHQPFSSSIGWYVGAGCICQSVWNYLEGYDVTYKIKDYDLIYYDATDLTKESEISTQQKISDTFADLPIDIEAVNEARVHLWYEQDYGKKINQLASCEDAINQWPTTANAIGVNKVKSTYNVYAPYGLNDLFGMIIRPNKPSVIRDVYEDKVRKWTEKWPSLTVIPWDQI